MTESQSRPDRLETGPRTMEFNLADLFECVVDQVPQREAVVCDETRLTYAALEQRANQLAHALVGLGVGIGDPVGLYLYNSAEFVEAMLACYKCRAVPFNINYRYGADELAYVLADAGAVAIVFSPELSAAVAVASSRASSLRWRVEIGPAFEDLVASGSPVRDFAPRSPDDHYLLYTGGTTGLPKGVVWRHEDIFFATLGGGNPGGPPITQPADIGRTVLVNRAQRLGPFLPAGDPGPDEFTALALGPLVHASGQWSALSTLLGGGRVVLYTHRSMDMGRVLDLIEREKVTMLTMVGDTSGRPLVDELADRAGASDTSALRLLGSGGSILSADVKERLMALLPSLLAINEAIGSSEAPVQAVSTVRRDGAAGAAGAGIAGTAGPSATTLRFAAKDVTMVLGADQRPVVAGSGEVGRLATRGHVPLGYHNDPERTNATFVEIDGVRWSLPGDMATIDADGTIQLLGRGSMCINTGGEKVYPEEVEAVLTAHAKVVDAVVVGVKDPKWGERVVAVVQPTKLAMPAASAASAASAMPAAPAEAPTLAELQEHCRVQLAGYKLPRALVVVDEVRRSPAGKADYAWAQSVAAAAAPVTPEGA